jgi:hypothetical protein
VAAHLGDPDVVLVVDETRFERKSGQCSAEIQRHDTGIAGQIPTGHHRHARPAGRHHRSATNVCEKIRQMFNESAIAANLSAIEGHFVRSGCQRSTIAAAQDDGRVTGRVAGRDRTSRLPQIRT